jgi:diadenosine tetraphosphate (Ap4A) HIT family hydrolase
VADNYILIDFENVHPKNLELVTKHPFKVFVFVGANQTKVPFDLADSMQLLGNDAKYIKIAGNGQNALDFHIAFYIGELAGTNPKAHFHIISKDKGFDPLIKFLREKRKIKVMRETDLAEIPLLRVPVSTSDDEKIAAIVKNLGGRGQSRPRKVRTLENTINTLFTRKLEKDELGQLIKELQKRKLMVVNQGNVSYKLPH